jgi:hypothetical protein
MVIDLHVLANRIVSLEAAAVLGDLTHEQQQCLIVLAHELRVEYAKRAETATSKKDLTPREIAQVPSSGTISVWRRRQEIGENAVTGEVRAIEDGQFEYRVTTAHRIPAAINHHAWVDNPQQTVMGACPTERRAKNRAIKVFNAEVKRLLGR